MTDPAATKSPSYDALLLMMQSVCGALDRAGLDDCDDPGEAIDVIREKYERRIALLESTPAAPGIDITPRPMDTAPLDGTMVRLLVQFDDHATEDSEGPAWTIGHCSKPHPDDDDNWQFAGWCWDHDHFTEGKGTPVGWLPLIDASPKGGSTSAPRLELTNGQIAQLADFAGTPVAGTPLDEQDVLVIQHAEAGHSGPGLYAHYDELPEEGAIYLDGQLPDSPKGGSDAEPMFYIQDTRSFVGNCPVWWGPNGNGYVTRLDEAGRFTEQEAIAQNRTRDTDVPWPCAEIDKLGRITVDVQHMRPRRERLAELQATSAEVGS